ncbi:DUF4240 domain-containing protein [Streptomyces viridochromogenes]|uniref:DUF4240 domain-containing protein n=1 Tax=Streptomyces viridochromogenes TaxID=1938 RepID=UPI001F1BC348|nr:DUF4240 domain-containing protein [Streptomyces viridochromogenes]
MNIDSFWNIIESARSSASASGRLFDEVLVDLLAGCPPQEILEYAEQFDEVHDALYRWDVWAAAYLIGGGCSDDSFMDFRAGVIALGRDWYERTAVDPDDLAGHPAVVAAASADDEALFYEDVNYAASGAFERLTGNPDSFHDAWAGYRSVDEQASDATDMGEEFDFDDADEMHRPCPVWRGFISEPATSGTEVPDRSPMSMTIHSCALILCSRRLPAVDRLARQVREQLERHVNFLNPIRQMHH